jgi:hypothetical protein
VDFVMVAIGLKRLTDFAQASAKTTDRLKFKDNTEELTATRFSGWKRVISSIATTEGAEEGFISPLVNFYSNEPQLAEYISSHQEDEARHSRILKDYLKSSFDYVKTHRTISDQIVYDRIFPILARVFTKKPLYCLSMVLFFEVFATGIYSEIKRQAESDHLSSLCHILTVIQKDEARHLTGIQLLISDYHLRFGRPGILDQIAIGLCLFLIMIDVNVTVFALHNRCLRKNIIYLGIDPWLLNRSSYRSFKKVFNQARGVHENRSDEL